MANQFLVKETMDAMRNLSTTEIDGLKGSNPTYVGVQLLGYYQKGDTPAPIIYHLVDLATDPDSGPDDGGSIITVGSSKFVHDFNGDINVSYFGARGNYINSSTYFDNADILQKILEIIGKGKITFAKGAYGFSKTLIIPTVDSDANSIELIFNGEGKLSSGGPLTQPNSGIVQLHYTGVTGNAAIRSDSKQSWLDFNNIALINASGRSDVDGLVMKNYRSNKMSNFSIILFRDNLSVNGDTYYTVFDKCSFTHAKRYNVYLNGLANMTTFRECRISLSELVGLRAPQIGDGINIIDCFLEGNKGAAVYVNNARLVNIKGSYIENNASVGEVLSGIRAQIIFGAYVNNLNTPAKLALERNYIMTVGDGCELVYALHSNSPTIGNINVSIIENTIPATLLTKDISANDRTYLVRCNYPSYLEVLLDNNKYSYTSKTKMYYPVNSRPSVLASWFSKNDDSVNFLRPEWNKAIFSKNIEDKGLITNKITYCSPVVLADGSNKDTAFDIDFDMPDVSTASVNIRHGRFTNTSGNIIEKWFNPTPGSMEETASLEYNTGKFRAKEYAIGTDGNTKIFAGQIVPEGNYFASKGSIYLYGGNTQMGIYYKTTDVTFNTGWLLMIPMQQSTAVANASTNPLPAAKQSSEAMDMTGIVSDLNDLISKYNALRQYVAENRTTINGILTTERVSGQRAV